MEFIHRITNLIFKVIMEEKTEFRISSSRGGERSTKDVYAEIRQGNSERWTIQSQKSKYVNGKLSVLELVILLASIIPRIIFWRKTRVTMRFRLLHKITVLLGFVYLHKMNLVIK